MLASGALAVGQVQARLQTNGTCCYWALRCPFSILLLHQWHVHTPCSRSSLASSSSRRFFRGTYSSYLHAPKQHGEHSIDMARCCTHMQDLVCCTAVVC
jgi:hypothetical protein